MKDEGQELHEKSLGTIVKGNSNEEKNYSPLEIRVYKRRWLTLLLFIFYSSWGACQWIQYSIITNIVTRYYGVSAMAVDWTSMCFMAYYVVLMFPAVYFVDRCGLKWAVVLGSGMGCIGSWIKAFSVAPDRFHISFIGQSIVAASQALVLILPGRLAAVWFGEQQTSTATSLGIIGCQIGIALSFLCTPMVVKNHANIDDIGKDLSVLFWTIAIVTSVAFVFILLFFKAEPRLPPSKTRALQKLARVKRQEDGFISPLKRLLKNKCYLLLCNTYGLNVGVLNAFSTLLNQIYLVHFENGEEDAGKIGLAVIITGILGAVTFGFILDKTHKFKETTVVVYFLTLCGQILFALFTYYEAKWFVFLSSIFLGFFMSGYIALGYEMCAEYTYPESEDVAAGILNVSNNLYGIFLVIIMGKLLETYGDVPVHIGLCASLFLGFILTVFTKDEQRRQDARRAAEYKNVNTKEEDLENCSNENS